MGIGMLTCLIGDSEKSLSRLLLSVPKGISDIWLLTHLDARTTARLRGFTKFLASAIESEQARLEGS